MSVYFAHCNGYVKIGYSKNPIQRIATITTRTAIKPDDVTYGDDVDLLGWVPGDRAVEKSMHQRFAHLHVVGEWFWDDDEYEQMLEADPFAAVQWMPGMSEEIMRENPTAPREAVIAAVEAEALERLSQGGAFFGTYKEAVDFRLQAQRVFADEQAARRQHFRALHATRRQLEARAS